MTQTRITHAYARWQKLFLFCLGLFIAAAFCMKWMEADLVHNGEPFSVIGLEVSYPKEKIMSLFSSLDPAVKKILRYHLSFDFLFMPGVFLGIMALDRMAGIKAGSAWVKRLLFILAWLQLLAWGLDITENSFLFSWLNNPVIGNEFGFFHLVVYLKWLIALAGIFVALPFIFKKGVG